MRITEECTKFRLDDEVILSIDKIFNPMTDEELIHIDNERYKIILIKDYFYKKEDKILHVRSIRIRKW